MTSGGRENLAQRVANTRAQHGTEDLHGTRPAPWEALAEPTPPDIRHCWYDGPNGRRAALLVGWRDVDGRYSGRIAVAALEADGWAIVEMWVDQGMLSPRVTAR